MLSLKHTILFILLETLVFLAGYLYSLRSDLVSWSALGEDGLYFIAFFLLIIPRLAIVSVARVALKATRLRDRLSYFGYSVVISLPALIILLFDHGGPLMFNIGVIICVTIAITHLLEFVLRKQYLGLTEKAKA